MECPPPYAPTLLQAPSPVERVVFQRLPDHCNVSVEATSAAMAPKVPNSESLACMLPPFFQQKTWVVEYILDLPPHPGCQSPPGLLRF